MKGESVAEFGLIIAFNDCDGVTMVLLTCLCGNRNDWWRLDVTFVSVCGNKTRGVVGARFWKTEVGVVGGSTCPGDHFGRHEALVGQRACVLGVGNFNGEFVNFFFVIKMHAGHKTRRSTSTATHTRTSPEDSLSNEAKLQHLRAKFRRWERGWVVTRWIVRVT